MTKQEEIIRTPEQKEAHKVYRASLRRDEMREGINHILHHAIPEEVRGVFVEDILAYLDKVEPLIEAKDD